MRLLRQVNAGKAAALNRAIAASSGDVLVCLDADTLFNADTLGFLVAPFVDDTVGAVAGNVKVGNRVNVWTRWQALEYVTSQNLDRRAYALLDAITVVPGAVGAWRRAAIEQAGGFRTDTLAEDMDLTWRVREQGWLMETESGAIAYTEAPESIKPFFKQRFRWAYGTLQCPKAVALDAVLSWAYSNVLPTKYQLALATHVLLLYDLLAVRDPSQIHQQQHP